MNPKLLCVCFLAMLVAADANAADCVKNQYGSVVCGEGQCATDQYGQVQCAQQGGGAVRDQSGDVKCGIGYCATNDLGEVYCSKRPGGGAATNSNGKVECLGGCQVAAKKLCSAAR